MGKGRNHAIVLQVYCSVKSRFLTDTRVRIEKWAGEHKQEVKLKKERIEWY